MRINARFRFCLLGRGRVASLNQILCRYLNPVHAAISVLRNSGWQPSAVFDLFGGGETWDHPRRLIHGGYPL